VGVSDRCGKTLRHVICVYLNPRQIKA
jgi:hypothetical protein